MENKIINNGENPREIVLDYIGENEKYAASINEEKIRKKLQDNEKEELKSESIKKNRI
ncbi:MAG: hypothetical protein V1860_02015 [bacterium]